MDTRTADYYDTNAATLAAIYESTTSPIESFFPLAFVAKGRVLDVGAGSGRDLAALLKAGYDAFGVEPSNELRAAALTRHPQLAGRLVEGALPSIGTPLGGCFDGIVCSAVLMHVPQPELFDAALQLRSLLKPHGRLLLSIPTGRTDVRQDHRDENGRLFEPYLPEELQLLFERLGFQQIGRWDTDDALQRAGTTWVTLLLELRAGGMLRAVDQIEGILNRDRKVATYKLALFRALAEIATQEPRAALWLAGGRIAIPIERIAQRWLAYYWPIVASTVFVPQTQAEGARNPKQPMAFRALLHALIQQFSNQGAHGGLSAWHLASTSGRLSPAVMAMERDTLRSIANTIRSGPVAFSGGALESGKVFEYDSQSKSVLMSAGLWRELSLLGHWIIDAVIVRWAALTERFAHRQGLRSGDVLPLLLACPEPERATAQARAIFRASEFGHCVWSGRTLTERTLAVDHVIPFSLWGNNDLWNLVPAHTAINNHKSDKLPASTLLLERRSSILQSWDLLRDAMPEAFDRQALNLLNVKPASNANLQNELFSRLREAIELTALQRGVERWMPRVDSEPLIAMQ